MQAGVPIKTVAAPLVEVRLLGRFAVVREGTEIPAADFGGRKVRSLLRMLAVRRGHFISHDVLSEMLWPDQQPADPAANLQVLVNRARRATRWPSLILTGPGGYALTSAPECQVDTEQFLAAATAGMAMPGHPGLEVLAAALSRFVGEPLAEDRYAEWARPYRWQVLRVRQDALERAAERAIECDDPVRAVDYASAAVTAEPLREVAALSLVRALAAAGDQVAALEHYAGYRRALAEELGLDPSPAAEAVHAELLKRGRLSVPIPRGVFINNPRHFDRLRFVGRQAEVEAIRSALEAADPIAPAIVTIAGRSGSGKSRLLAEVISGLRTVSVRAYWPERSEPWSLARALLSEFLATDVTLAYALPAQLYAGLASILPELEKAGDHVEPASLRPLIFEAAVRLCVRVSEAVICVDDLQWGDPTSVQLLGVLAERVPGVSMVLAYRPEEIDHGSESATLLRRLSPASSVELGGLSDDAIADLTADPALAAALAAHTDRTPLAIAEVLRPLAREAAVTSDDQGRWSVHAADAATKAAERGSLGQRRAIERRAAAYSGPALQTLRLVALIAREVSPRTLAAASGTSEPDTIDVLTTLSDGGLVRLGERGWATAHDMVGAAVVDQLDDTLRGRLHLLVARALEAEGGDAAELAGHWRGAGELARAAQAYATAAEQALEAFADREAEELADAGLRDAVPVGLAARLQVVRAQARQRRGDLPGARTDLRAALGAYPTGPARARVLAALATLASGADDLLRASELVEAAIVEAGDDPAARARTLEVAAIVDMNLERPTRAAARAADALALFRGLNDSRGAARILDARAMASFLAGNIREGTDLLHRAANLFEDSGDLMRVVTPRSTRGHGLVFLGMPEAGLADASQALEIARNLGHPEGQAYALWHCSEALSALGEAEQAVDDGNHALAIASRIGHRGWMATAWRAIGIGEQSRGDPEKALAAFQASAARSDNLDLFCCWANARAASVLIAMLRLDDAAVSVQRALSLGPPLGHYEARLAQVELAVARSDDNAPVLARHALDKARAGGALSDLRRLSALADP